MGFFDKLKQGLAKTKAAFITPLEKLFSSAEKVDEDFYDELLDVLIMADVGVETSDYIVETLRDELKKKNISNVYLITTHTKFYERCGFDYYGDIEEDDGNLVRCYHKSLK